MTQITVSKKDKTYILSEIQDPNWPYFLENEEGEGMSMSETNLFDLLDDYMKKEF